jgi:uncharacterized protein (DUF488 family)
VGQPFTLFSLFTLGHSTRTFDELVAICRGHGVRVVADVRRFPGSRRSPHFARQALEGSLPAEGIAYQWIAALGGRRRRPKGAPPSAWRVEAFAAYADHINTPEFRAGFEQVLAMLAAGPTAVMCAEASPYRCHRRLISDWAELHGIAVVHLLDQRRAERHRLTPFARLAGDDVRYDEGAQLELPIA